MPTIQSEVSELVTKRSDLEVGTICCYPDAEVSRWTSLWVLSGERLLAAQALQLLMSLDRELREARADWNQDRFRRVMRTRSKAVSRVRRRWNSLNPVPTTGLGELRRRYHANLAGYLYEQGKSVGTEVGNEDKNLQAEGQRCARSRAPACIPRAFLVLAVGVG